MKNALAWLTARPRVFYVLGALVALALYLWSRKRPVNVQPTIVVGEPTVTSQTARDEELDRLMGETYTPGSGNWEDQLQ